MAEEPYNPSPIGNPSVLARRNWRLDIIPPYVHLKVTTSILGLSDVLFLSEQNGVIDRFCHLPAQTLASDVVSAEVLPCVNTA